MRMIMILRSIRAEQGQPNTIFLSRTNVPGFLTKGATHTVKPKHLLLSRSSCSFNLTTEMIKVTSKWISHDDKPSWCHSWEVNRSLFPSAVFPWTMNEPTCSDLKQPKSPREAGSTEKGFRVIFSLILTLQIEASAFSLPSCEEGTNASE